MISTKIILFFENSNINNLLKINNTFGETMNIVTQILKDQSGQGAAEYILLFGGVIAIAMAALLIYKSYFVDKKTDLNASNDINNIRNQIN